MDRVFGVEGTVGPEAVPAVIYISLASQPLCFCSHIGYNSMASFALLLPNWGSAAGPLGHPFPGRVGLPMASAVWLVRVRTRL